MPEHVHRWRPARYFEREGDEWCPSCYHYKSEVERHETSAIAPLEHVHEWKSAKAIGYEDDAICFGCHHWRSDFDRFKALDYWGNEYDPHTREEEL